MPLKTDFFDQTKAKMAPAHGTSLDAILTEWEGADVVAQRAASNLRAEHGSVESDLSEYLHKLAANQAKLGMSGVGPKVTFEALGSGFTLAGHEATPYQDAIFGRAMQVNNYVRHLLPALDKLRCHDSEEDARVFIRELDGKIESTVRPELRPYFEAIRQTFLGGKAIFATFLKPFDATKRPWRAGVITAKSIRESLALGLDDPTQDYLLFAYKLPADVSPKVPTTASPGWSYQQWFRPNEDALTQLHGWTEPLRRGVAKRAEIVHQQIIGTSLLFPLRLAQA